MDDLATRCRTVATRLSKPHSEHIKDAAFDHLHEAAAALAASAARIEIARRGLIVIAHTYTEDSHGGMKTYPSHYYMDKARETLAALDAALQPSRED